MELLYSDIFVGFFFVIKICVNAAFCLIEKVQYSVLKWKKCRKMCFCAWKSIFEIFSRARYSSRPFIGALSKTQSKVGGASER